MSRYRRIRHIIRYAYIARLISDRYPVNKNRMIHTNYREDYVPYLPHDFILNSNSFERLVIEMWSDTKYRGPIEHVQKRVDK